MGRGVKGPKGEGGAHKAIETLSHPLERKSHSHSARAHMASDAVR